MGEGEERRVRAIVRFGEVVWGINLIGIMLSEDLQDMLMQSAAPQVAVLSFRQA